MWFLVISTYRDIVWGHWVSLLHQVCLVLRPKNSIAIYLVMLLTNLTNKVNFILMLNLLLVLKHTVLVILAVGRYSYFSLIRIFYVKSYDRGECFSWTAGNVLLLRFVTILNLFIFFRNYRFYHAMQWLWKRPGSPDLWRERIEMSLQTVLGLAAKFIDVGGCWVLIESYKITPGSLLRNWRSHQAWMYFFAQG